jgi:hypothetical protein
VAYWAPALLRNRAAALAGRSAAAAPGLAAAVDYTDRIAHLRADGAMSVSGVGTGPGSYLAAWQERPLAESSVIVADGNLVRGGLTIGLTNASGWVDKVDIDTPGPFRAFVQAPHAGRYQVVVANHLTAASLRNRFTISRFVVVDGKP